MGEQEETFCKRCRQRLKVAAAGLCTVCAAIVATPAVSIAAPPPVTPTYQFYRPWSPGDSEPFHPAEPDPTLDGPEFSLMGTVPTWHLVIELYGHWRPSRQRYNGGAAPTA